MKNSGQVKCKENNYNSRHVVNQGVYLFGIACLIMMNSIIRSCDYCSENGSKFFSRSSSSSGFVVAFQTSPQPCRSKISLSSRHYNSLLFSSASSDAMNPKSRAKRKVRAVVEPDPVTLYELLDIRSTATRPEIKKRYLELARQLHPDANISNSNPSQDNPTNLTFVELSRAYEVLSCPRERKRYDRDLRAKEITRDIEDAAEGLFKSVFRSTSKAFAAVQDTGKQVKASNRSNNNGSNEEASSSKQSRSNSAQPEATQTNVFDFASAAMQALRKGLDAGKIVDNLELIEKAEQLEKTKYSYSRFSCNTVAHLLFFSPPFFFCGLIEKRCIFPLLF